MKNILCPICKKPLAEFEKFARCEEGHSFDRAKEGYFYLLPPNAKNSKVPGDNADMVRARKLFLDDGSYAPLANRLASVIDERVSSPAVILDAGVGTGYYLRTVAERRGYKDDYIGVDISKEAVRLSSRAMKSGFFAVASVFDMPIESESVDVALCVFSPFAEKEYFRVLKRGGILIAVTPAESHLIELRRALYDDVRPVEGELCNTYLQNNGKEELTFRFSLDSSAEISSLLTMTPYVFNAPKNKADAVKATPRMVFTADLAIHILKKPN